MRDGPELDRLVMLAWFVVVCLSMAVGTVLIWAGLQLVSGWMG